MKAWRIVWSQQASDELQGIYDYIEYETHEPDIASQQVNRILDMVDKLEYMPAKFKRIDMEPLRSRGWHIVTVDRYSILYCLNQERQDVKIMAIMHSRQNIDKFLRDIPLA